MKKIYYTFVFLLILFLGLNVVNAQKITREYRNEEGEWGEPFIIQYDTETKKYEFGSYSPVNGAGEQQKYNIEVNGNKYMLGSYFFNQGVLGKIDYTIYLNESDTPIELKENESLELYYCKSANYGSTNINSGTVYATIFSDEAQYELYKEELEYEMVSCHKLVSNEVKNNTDGIVNRSECQTYYDFYDAIEDYYEKYNNNKAISYIGIANKELEKLKQICRSITQYSDYGTNCLNKCLNLNNDISNLRKTYGIENYSSGQCGFSEKLIIWIANIVKWIKYIIPIIVIVLGILDFIKAISSNKEDEMKKAQGHFTKRLIAAALIFIIPFILEFILNKMGFAANGCGIIDL